MITTYCYLCALPRSSWEIASHGLSAGMLHSFVDDALIIERRLHKGVNQENERARYNLCCSRIEATIPPQLFANGSTSKQFREALAGQKVPAVALEAGYLSVVALLLEKAPLPSAELRIGTTFFPPDSVATHHVGFQQLSKQYGIDQDADVRRRLAFFELAGMHDCGVIEVQNAFQYRGGLNIVSPYTKPVVSERVVTATSLVDEDYVENEGRNLFEILRDDIQRAIRAALDGRPGLVNFSNQPHNVITEVLRESVYRPSGYNGPPIAIQVIYTDGSQGDPFPVYCLPQRANLDVEQFHSAPVLRVALMSMRHLEMDRDVDMAWLRNSEVSKARTLAETDRFCFQQSRQQLQDAIALGALRLHVYQTGFQPAVIGLYRAVVQEIMQRIGQPPVIEVVPWYFSRRNGYRSGRPWY